MTDPIQLRRRIRWALRKDDRRSEEMLFDKLAPDFPGLKVDELRYAISWNHEKGWIEYRYNEHEERVEWSLSDSGRKEEGIG